MSFPLAFTQEFFIGSGRTPRPSRKPTSVIQAIVSLPHGDRLYLARDLFHCEPAKLDAETVLKKVLQTNTCTNLDSPVEVWIDAAGWFTLLVYEKGNNLKPHGCTGCGSVCAVLNCSVCSGNTLCSKCKRRR